MILWDASALSPSCIGVLSVLELTFACTVAPAHDPHKAELILESTPEGAGGCFYEEWKTAEETGMVRHFFPWWMERHYCAKAVDQGSLSEEERVALFS